MRNGLLVLAMLAGAALFSSSSAGAYEGPWCAVVGLGPGSTTERCDFRDFESCRQEITGGNRGFCNHNPRWTGGTTSERTPRRRARHY
jgi:hypothetical protein